MGKEGRKGSYNICSDDINSYGIYTCLDIGVAQLSMF